MFYQWAQVRLCFYFIAENGDVYNRCRYCLEKITDVLTEFLLYCSSEIEQNTRDLWPPLLCLAFDFKGLSYQTAVVLVNKGDTQT